MLSVLSFLNNNVIFSDMALRFEGLVRSAISSLGVETMKNHFYTVANDSAFCSYALGKEVFL